MKYGWGFHFLNEAMFGVKGSNWMVHAEIEKNVGFDVGLARSVGEDWSAMFLMNNAG